MPQGMLLMDEQGRVVSDNTRSWGKVFGILNLYSSSSGSIVDNRFLEGRPFVFPFNYQSFDIPMLFAPAWSLNGSTLSYYPSTAWSASRYVDNPYQLYYGAY